MPSKKYIINKMNELDKAIKEIKDDVNKHYQLDYEQGFDDGLRHGFMLLKSYINDCEKLQNIKFEKDIERR